MNETDEEHPMHSSMIMAKLQDQGYSISRNTLHDDLKVLKSFDLDIVTVVSRDNSYFLGDRKFEMPELKMLKENGSRRNELKRHPARLEPDRMPSNCYLVSGQPLSLALA